jgi:hypothetical protein
VMDSGTLMGVFVIVLLIALCLALMTRPLR